MILILFAGECLHGSVVAVRGGSLGIFVSLEGGVEIFEKMFVFRRLADLATKRLGGGEEASSFRLSPPVWLERCIKAGSLERFE